MVDFAKLAAPFPPEKIHWRVGSTNQDKTRGLALAYLDARDVMDRLDQVCGPEGWQCRYSHVGDKVACEIGIFSEGSGKDENGRYLRDEWIWKADGAGDTDFEGAKGSFSGAFKRAAVRWGIGRYLYDLPAEWVDLDERRQIKRTDLDRLQKRITPSGGNKMHGPLKITELKEKLRELSADINTLAEAESLEESEVVALRHSYAGELTQAMYDLPAWYYGSEAAPGALTRLMELEKKAKGETA